MLASLTLMLCLQAPGLDLEAARETLEDGDAEALEALEGSLADELEGLHERERALRLLLAEARTALGDPHGALAVLEPLPFDDPEVARRRAFAFLDLGYGLEARRSYEDAGWAFGEARAAFDVVLEAAEGPPDEDVVLSAGYLAIDAFGEYQRAIDIADQLLVEHPDHGEALLMRGIAGVQLYAQEIGKASQRALADLRDMAEVDLLRAERLLPDDWYEPQEQLAWLYETSGRPREAVRAAIAVVDAAPDYGFGTLVRLARRYGAEGEPAGAEALAAMVERDPDALVERIREFDDPGQVAVELSWNGGAFFERGDLDALRRVLGTLLRIEPEDADLYNNHAFVCRETGHYEEAYASYARAVELAGDDPRTLNDAALILTYHLGRDLEHADELYARAIALAEEQLGAEDLDPERRAYLEEALRDARNNRRLNEARMATGEAPVDPARAAPDEPAPPDDEPGNETNGGGLADGAGARG